MISFDQMRKALARVNLNPSDYQLTDLLNDLLPNPQAGFSCGGVNVWGDKKSIDAVQRWMHDSGNLQSLSRSWREQVDSNQQRAMRAEELGLKLLNYVLCQSASNPASRGLAVNEAIGLLMTLNIEPREGFYVDQDAALADARTKFYDAAHPRPTPEGSR